MKRMLKLAVILIIFIVSLQLAVHWWLSEPAPHFPVFAKKGFEVIAHRGGSEFAPPSTLEAMRSAAAAGTDVLEMDIHSSSDGHIVVFHDQTLDRTTSCHGGIKEKSLAELQTCDKGSKGIRIPTLHAVFNAFQNKRMIIEIKQHEPSLVPGFCRLIRSFKKQDHLIVGSFRQEPLDEFRKACPEVATSATPKEATLFILAGKIRFSRLISPVYTALQIPPKVPLPGILPNIDVATPSLVEQAHEKNLAVQVWTINEAQQMQELIAAGVDGIMTDYPSKLRDIVRKSK